MREQRIIKFRAWDGANMHSVVGAGFNVYSIQHSTVLVNGIPMLLRDNITYMQFTGLKDKNGKEIYEGDIVEFEGWHGGIEHQLLEKQLAAGGFPPPDYMERRVILGHPNGHYITRKLDDTKDMIYVGDTLTHSIETFARHYEVIGNIYENKDLL